MKKADISPTSVVSEYAKIGEGTVVWNFAQIREGAVIGKNCNIANGVYIDKNVKIGDNVVVQNKSSIYRNTVIEDGVFIGPNVCFINDKNPRSGVVRELKNSWVVGKGATIGAGSIIMPDTNIGRYSLIGAGSLVTKDVPDHALVYGNPSILRGFVCECGQILDLAERKKAKQPIKQKDDRRSSCYVVMKCKKCSKQFDIDKKSFNGIR